MMDYHVIDKLCGIFRVDKGVKRMRGTESVPQAEGAVIGLSFRHLLDFEVSVHITSVDIAHRVWLHQDMVKPSVEYGFLLIGALDVNAAELFLPDVMGSFHITVEVPAFSLGKHVLACAVVVDRRYCHLDNQFVTVFRVEIQGCTQSPAIHHVAVADVEFAVHQKMSCNRLRKLCSEINFSHFRPSSDDAISFDGIIIDDAYLRLNHIVTPSA